MDIADMATEEYLDAAPDERIGDVRSLLEADDTAGVQVVSERDPMGVVTPRDLLRSQVDDDAAVESVLSRAPTLSRDTHVREAARQLVESRSRLAPVTRDGELWGCLSADELLVGVREYLDAIEVGQIQTDDPVTVTADATMGEAVNLLREHGISRLPVISHDGRLERIVTTRDLVEFVVRDPERPAAGERVGDDERLLDLPVRDVASRPVETATAADPVNEAVATMLEHDHDGLVVVPEDGRTVEGVVTKTDVLRALCYTGEEHPDVTITNVDLLERTTRETVAERIEAVADKDSELRVIHAAVRLQQHAEELRGQQLARCKIRLRTDHDTVIASGEGYGADQALSVALDKLERNVLERKGRRNDREYRGQLRRKLGEL